MEKVYINKPVGREEELTRNFLISNLESKGVVVTPYITEADTIFRYAEGMDQVSEKLSYLGKDKKDVLVYSVDDNGEVNIFSNDSNNDMGYYIRTKAQPKTVACPVSEVKIAQLSDDIIDYLTGKTNEITLVDPMPLNALYRMIEMYIVLSRRNVRESDKAELRAKYNLTDKDLEIIKSEISSLVHYGKDSELLSMFRRVKSIWTLLPIYSGVKGIIVPNNSDNILINLVNARISQTFFSKSKDESKKKDIAARYQEYTGNVIATARNSMFGTNKGFQTYCKIDQEQNGIYGLFIINNKLADGEVLIPHPANMDLNSSRKEVNFMGNKHEVIFLYSRKTIIINGPDAKKLRVIYRNGHYSHYKIYINSDKKMNIKEYPEIGDYVVVTRHPVTTLVLRLKVVGFTKGCSIRVNAKTALALYGDADGDSFVVSWSKWTDEMELHGVTDLDEFCKAAEIEMDTVAYENNFDIEDFTSLMADDEETCLRKSSESGLEQARAKLMTKQWTGAWGAAEMSLVQTAIIEEIDFTMEMIYKKSLLSQVLVQAKNILSDLQSGNGLSQEVKDTIVLMAHLKGTTLKAAEPVSALLNISKREAVDLINEYKGIVVPKKIVEEKVEDEYDFYRENADIILQR